MQYYQSIPINYLTILKLTPAEAIVLSKIRSLESDRFGGVCISRYDQVAEYIGISTAAVTYAIKKLIEKDLIRVGEYIQNSTKYSRYKSYYKKTTDLVDEVLSYNGISSLYINIPNEILTSKVMNATNKLLYGIVLFLRNRADIRCETPIHWKHIKEFIGGNRITINRNINTLRDLTLIDYLGYGYPIKDNQEIYKEKKLAPRGKHVALTSSDKEYIATLSTERQDVYIQAVKLTKRYYRASLTKEKQNSSYILDLPFHYHDIQEKVDITDVRVENYYHKAMLRIKKQLGIIGDDFRAYAEAHESLYERTGTYTDPITKVDIRETFISVHINELEQASNYDYIKEFPSNYFSSMYVYFPNIFERLIYSKQYVTEKLIEIKSITEKLGTWQEEFNKEFSSQIHLDILKSLSEKIDTPLDIDQIGKKQKVCLHNIQ